MPRATAALRSLAGYLAVVTAVPVAAVVLPVSGPAAVHPHAVAPHVHSMPASTAATPSPFDLVGAHWHPGALPPGARLQVQVHQDGHWSGWNDLSPMDAAPDDGSADARSAAAHKGRDIESEPLWVDAADGVRTRVLGSGGHELPVPAGADIVLVDGGSSNADAAVVDGRTASSTAYAGTNRPVIHTRADWGADESLRLSACPQGPDYASTVKVGFVHHTATSSSYTAADVPSIIRSIYAYHVRSNGWCDIGYNFLVDRFGGIWEGRYGGMDRPVIGAHTGGFNTDSFGVSMIGDFASASPPQATTDAVARLMAWRLGLTNRDPAGSGTLKAGSFSESHCLVGGRDTSPCPPGTPVTFRAISGHRDADLTSCPGDAGYATLPSIRTAARSSLGLGMVDPAVAGGSPVYGDGKTVSVVAGLIGGSATWTLTVTDHATGVPLRVQTGTATSTIRATWDRRSLGGLLALPGVYDLRLDAFNASDRAAPFTASVTVQPPSGTTFVRSDTAQWHMTPGTTVSFGSAQGRLLAGDWDGDGVDTPAVVELGWGDTWVWHVADRSGAEAARFSAGSTSCVPVAGDWDGDGRTTAGVACPTADGWRWQLWNTPDASGTPGPRLHLRRPGWRAGHR